LSTPSSAKPTTTTTTTITTITTGTTSGITVSSQPKRGAVMEPAIAEPISSKPPSPETTVNATHELIGNSTTNDKIDILEDEGDDRDFRSSDTSDTKPASSISGKQTGDSTLKRKAGALEDAFDGQILKRKTKLADDEDGKLVNCKAHVLEEEVGPMPVIKSGLF
jgi:hypothetical protein